MNTAKNQLFVLLRDGLPLVTRPFADLGQCVGLTENQVLECVQAWVAHGAEEKVSATFDLRRLGYRSVLCAIHEPHAERLDALAGRIAMQPGITHCYERSWPVELNPHGIGGPRWAVLPNLWFVLVSLQDEFEAAVQALRTCVASYEVLILPARKRFKIDVTFEPEERMKGESFPCGAEPLNVLSAAQQDLVRALQVELPVVADCYARVARRVGMSESALLTQLREWKAMGVLRRLALVLGHGESGSRVKAMCIWSVEEGCIMAAGRALATLPYVEHCYERLATNDFGYNLFAMIRASNWLEAQQRFEQLESVTGIKGGHMRCSVREFKKTGLNYFSPDREAVLV